MDISEPCAFLTGLVSNEIISKHIYFLFFGVRMRVRPSWESTVPSLLVKVPSGRLSLSLRHLGNSLHLLLLHTVEDTARWEIQEVWGVIGDHRSTRGLWSVVWTHVHI